MAHKGAKPATYEEAWAAPPPTTGGWTARPWVHRTERADAGHDARKRVPRPSHGAFEAAPDRDPIAILEAQEADRLPELIPLRHQRMAASAFAYYRGAPAVMAFDLALSPRTGIIVQASGDAHLSNFGLFASPERTLVFDANDFDETLPAPWEWDVKRLAASFVIAGRGNGFSPAQSRVASTTAVSAYRHAMRDVYASMPLLAIWYARITDADIVAAAELTIESLKDKAAKRAKMDAVFSKARRRDGLKAFDQLTALVDGRRVIVDDPPVVQHFEIGGGPEVVEETFAAYRATLSEDRRDLLERYRLVDFALKVVGVGSVGTRCFVILLEGHSETDPLILQAKEATASVLAPYVEHTPRVNQGERVVAGQRLMQATPDIFLGWTRGPEGRDFYFRQLWDMKGSVEVSELEPPGLNLYAVLCGQSLARAHARSGDATAIAAYLGSSDTFDGAIADFAEAYADQNERDHAAFVAAMDSGRITGGSTVSSSTPA
jgi:Uncharacterized protein conserved in bacteria (DUF2252)